MRAIWRMLVFRYENITSFFGYEEITGIFVFGVDLSR